MNRFIEELKRRQVIKSAGIYIVFAWVLLQVADVVVPAAGWPDWVVTFVLYLMILGFPFVLILSWMFDLTKEGVEREAETPSIKPLTLGSPPILLMMLVLSGGAYFAWQKALPPPDRTPSIAVIPFENLTGDESQNYLSDGITEEIMNNLFRMKNLKVIARTSVYAVKDLNLELSQIGARLDVEHILEGNLQVNGEVVRLAVRMIEVATGKRLWSETFDGQLSDFEFQDSITSTVTGAISGQLGLEPPPVKKAATREGLAREYYLRGRYYFEQRVGESMQRAQDLFQQAIDVDPLYADAWAALGHTMLLNNPAGLLEIENKRVDAAIERALEYDPENAQAFSVKANIALFRDWDLRAATEFSERAVLLAPGSGDARHFHAIVLGMVGRHNAALAEQRIALDLNPLYPPLLSGLGHRLKYLWRFEEAAEIYEQSIQNGFTQVYANLFFTYGELGRIDDARKAYLAQNQFDEPDNQGLMYLAYYSGDQQEASRLYQAHMLATRPPAIEGDSWAMLDAAIAGDLDYSFAVLHTGAENRDVNMLRLLRSKKTDALYTDPRWVEFWNHPNLKPLFELYLESGDVPWLSVMNAAIAEREKQN